MTSDLIWQSSSAPTHGTIGDINTMRISPDFLGIGQDVIIDTAGILRSRGALKSVTTDTFTNLQVLGCGQTANGAVLIASDAANNTYFYGTSSALLTGFAKQVSGGYGAVTANSLTSVGIFQLWH